MKICVDGREFVAQQRTGIGRYLENLLTPLVSEPELEIVLFVRDPDFVPQALRNSAARCVKLPLSPTFLVDQVVLPWLAAREKAEVFFSPYYKVPLSGKFKRIITVHDIMFLRLPSSQYRISNILFPIKKFLAGQQLRLAVRKSDLILVDSEFTRKDLSDLLPASARKLKVLYPSLEPDWMNPVEQKLVLEAQSRYAENKPFLLYVGNFKPHKNVDLLIRAFLDLAAEGKTENRCLLLVGGDPKNLPRIEALVRSAGKEDLIRICPDVDDITLKTLYSAAEWFITASEYEGFGYPILEAMAGGCPVICHPCTSIPEVTGECALYIPRIDQAAIAETLYNAISMDTSTRDELVEKGRVRARKFLCGDSARSFLDALETLSASAGPDLHVPGKICQ